MHWDNFRVSHNSGDEGLQSTLRRQEETCPETGWAATRQHCAFRAQTPRRNDCRALTLVRCQHPTSKVDFVLGPQCHECTPNRSSPESA